MKNGICAGRIRYIKIKKKKDVVRKLGHTSILRVKKGRTGEVAQSSKVLGMQA